MCINLVYQDVVLDGQAELREILETLKTLSLEIFNMINQVKQSKYKKMMLEKYLGQLQIVD